MLLSETKNKLTLSHTSAVLAYLTLTPSLQFKSERIFRMLQTLQCSRLSGRAAALQLRDQSVLTAGLEARKRCPPGLETGRFTVKSSAMSTSGKTVVTKLPISEFPKGEEFRIPVPWGFIAGKAWGSRDGLPVLGLHGFMDNAGTFDILAPLLTPQLCLLAIDLPGHGLSSHIPAGIPYHYNEWLIAVRRVVNYLNWEKYSLIGHSMGAGISSIYSSVYAKEVQDIVLLDLVKPVTITQADYVSSIGAGIEKFLSIEQKTNKLTTYSYDELLSRFMKPGNEELCLTEEAAKCLMLRALKQAKNGRWSLTRDVRLHGITTLTFPHDVALAILNQIECRTLLALGNCRPSYEPQEQSQAAIDIYKQKCKQFQMIEMEGNHFFHLNKAVETALLINEFLIPSVSNL